MSETTDGVTSHSAKPQSAGQAAGYSHSTKLQNTAVQADIQLDAANSTAMFVDAGNTYVYYAGTAIGNADDQLIQLTGITTLTTITGGAATAIA